MDPYPIHRQSRWLTGVRSGGSCGGVGAVARLLAYSRNHAKALRVWRVIGAMFEPPMWHKFDRCFTSLIRWARIRSALAANCRAISSDFCASSDWPGAPRQGDPFVRRAQFACGRAWRKVAKADDRHAGCRSSRQHGVHNRSVNQDLRGRLISPERAWHVAPPPR